MQRAALPTRKWVNDLHPPLINMRITYLICKLPKWYSYALDWYANYLIDIHKSLIDMQII